jgi:hypothetical protein
VSAAIALLNAWDVKLLGQRLRPRLYTLGGILMTRRLEIEGPRARFLISRAFISEGAVEDIMGDILDTGSRAHLTAAKIWQQRNQFQDLASGNRVTGHNSLSGFEEDGRWEIYLKSPI